MARVNRFALSDVMGSQQVVYVYWAAAFIACLFVIFGYRTRLALVVLYVFIAGFNERLPELFDGSDSVIRLTVFWLCFCPAGNCYSVDSILARVRGAPRALTGMALPMRIVQAQIAWVYLCSALHKTGGLTWHLVSNTGSGAWDFNNAALHYVLHLGHVFARPWAAMLADYPIPMVVGTVFTMCFEFGFTALVFSPVANRTTKALGLLGGLALHGGIALTVNVGLFSYLMPVTYLAFFEPEWTAWLIDRLKGLCGQGQTTVLYDARCAVCARGAVALRSLDRFGNLALCDLHEKLPDAAKDLKKAQLEQRLHAVRPDGSVRAGWWALASALRRVPGGFVLSGLMRVPGLAQLGTAAYARISEHRHQLAKLEGLPLAPPAPVERPPLVPLRWQRAGRDLGALALVLLFVSAAWYAAPQPGRRALPRVADEAVQWLSLWNVWDMFSPEPLRTDYHLRAPAEFSDGSTGDLFGGPVNGPGEVRGFWFSRWWKYLENVTQGSHVIQEQWARWQCKSHNWGDGPAEHGGKRLYKFRLLRDNQIIPPIGQPWPPVQTAEVVNWRCYDKPQDKKTTPAISRSP